SSRCASTSGTRRASPCIPRSPKCPRPARCISPIPTPRPGIRRIDALLFVEGAGPGAVLFAGAVGELEAVGAEEIALALREVSGAAGLAVAVEIAERGRQADQRKPAFRTRRYDVSQRNMGIFHDLHEVGDHEQVRRLALGVG